MTPEKILHIQPVTLNERLEKGDDICLIDVRDGWEYSLASIKGSNHIPLNELADRVQEIMFEEEIAAYTGAKYAITVDSCTNALFLVCK